MNTTKHLFETIATMSAIVMFVDFCGFTLWLASGQFPADNFYIGAITAHILKLFL